MNKPAIIIIFLVIAAVLAFLFVAPKYQEYHQLQARIREKEAKFSGESIYFARISDILAGLESRLGVLDKIQSALPADVSVAPLVDFLQKKGSENGISITSVVFSQLSGLALGQIPQASVPGQAKDILFTVNATGSYQGLKGFLMAMDNSARLFEMESVSFSPAGTAGAARNRAQEYSLKLEVKTHSH